MLVGEKAALLDGTKVTGKGSGSMRCHKGKLAKKIQFVPIFEGFVA